MAALIGASVEGKLDALLWQVLLGDVELYQVTPALAAWWTVAHEEGRAQGYASRQAEVETITADRDYWHSRVMHPGKQIQTWRASQLDLAAESFWEEFIQTGGDVK